MKTRFSDDGVIVYIDYDGAVSIAEWVSAITALTNDPRYRAGIALIADRTRAEPPTTAFVRAVADYHLSYPDTFRDVRLALVVPDMASLGMGRMGQTFLDERGVSFEIFDDMEKAESWARGGSWLQ